MAIHVCVQYNRGLLPDIIPLTLCDYYIVGEYYLQYMILYKNYYNNPESLDAFRFFFKQLL